MAESPGFEWRHVENFNELNEQQKALLKSQRVFRPVSILTFFQNNVAASQSGVVLDAGLGAISEHVMSLTGHIIAASIFSNDERTAGELSVSPTIDGTELDDELVLDATDTEEATIEIEKSLSSFFLSGQRIGAKITTDSSWAPTTADIIVSIMVQFDMGRYHG